MIRNKNYYVMQVNDVQEYETESLDDLINTYKLYKKDDKANGIKNKYSFFFCDIESQKGVNKCYEIKIKGGK